MQAISRSHSISQLFSRGSLGVLLFLSMGLPQASPAVSADFEAGVGTSLASEFVGVAGDGWTSAWAQNTRTGVISATQAHSTENPISGVGSLFLTSTTTSTANNNATVSNLRRSWDGSTGVNPAGVFQISFDFRVHEISGDNAFGDYVQFFLRGTSQGTSNFNAGVGGFRVRFDGALQIRDGGSTLTVPTASFQVVDSETYRYMATVNPVTSQWSFSIQNLSAPSIAYSADNLSFGGGFDGVTWVHFGTAVNNKVTTDWSATSAWTVDNLQIIPEPATFSALLGLLVALTTLSRFRAPIQSR